MGPSLNMNVFLWTEGPWCKHRASTVQAPCKHRASTVQAPCKHQWAFRGWLDYYLSGT
jgi:hypothetical protein